MVLILGCEIFSVMTADALSGELETHLMNAGEIKCLSSKVGMN